MNNEEYLQTRARSYSKTDKDKMAEGNQDKSQKANGKPLNNSNEIEDNSNKGDVQKTLKKPVTEQYWMDMFTKLRATLDGVQQELVDLKTIKGTVTNFTETFNTKWKKEVDDKIQVLELCDSDTDFYVKLLADMVIKQDEQIKELQGKVEATYKREVKPNIIISGISEVVDENYATLSRKVAAFFTEELKIKEDIQVLDMFRTGTKYRRDRPILVKLQHPSDKRQAK